MIVAVTRVKSIEGTTMTLESSVTVYENDDLVSFDKESKKLSCGEDWQAESMKFHNGLCRAILLKSAKGLHT
jgi:hypothetical protein